MPEGKAKWQAAQPMEIFQNEGWGPGEAVAMDVATLPWGDSKYRYLLVMVDLFSHYIELPPLHNQTADTIVEEFKRSWIYRGHGVPKILLTDQGHNVDGREVATCVKRWELKNATPRLTTLMRMEWQNEVSEL